MEWHCRSERWNLPQSQDEAQVPQGWTMSRPRNESHIQCRKNQQARAPRVANVPGEKLLAQHRQSQERTVRVQEVDRASRAPAWDLGAACNQVGLERVLKALIQRAGPQYQQKLVNAAYTLRNTKRMAEAVRMQGAASTTQCSSATGPKAQLQRSTPLDMHQFADYEDNFSCSRANSPPAAQQQDGLLSVPGFSTQTLESLLDEAENSLPGMGDMLHGPVCIFATDDDLTPLLHFDDDECVEDGTTQYVHQTTALETVPAARLSACQADSPAAAAHSCDAPHCRPSASEDVDMCRAEEQQPAPMLNTASPSPSSGDANLRLAAPGLPKRFAVFTAHGEVSGRSDEQHAEEESARTVSDCSPRCMDDSAASASDDSGEGESASTAEHKVKHRLSTTAAKKISKRGASVRRGNIRVTCRNCGTHQTPQWRCGPEGPRTLCNACGVRFKKGLPLAYMEHRTA